MRPEGGEGEGRISKTVIPPPPKPADEPKLYTEECRVCRLDPRLTPPVEKGCILIKRP